MIGSEKTWTVDHAVVAAVLASILGRCAALLVPRFDASLPRRWNTPRSLSNRRVCPIGRQWNCTTPTDWLAVTFRPSENLHARRCGWARQCTSRPPARLQRDWAGPENPIQLRMQASWCEGLGCLSDTRRAHPPAAAQRHPGRCAGGDCGQRHPCAPRCRTWPPSAPDSAVGRGLPAPGGWLWATEIGVGAPTRGLCARRGREGGGSGVGHGQGCRPPPLPSRRRRHYHRRGRRRRCLQAGVVPFARRWLVCRRALLVCGRVRDQRCAAIRCRVGWRRWLILGAVTCVYRWPVWFPLSAAGRRWRDWCAGWGAAASVAVVTRWMGAPVTRPRGDAGDDDIVAVRFRHEERSARRRRRRQGESCGWQSLMGRLPVFCCAGDWCEQRLLVGGWTPEISVWSCLLLC